jgi:hypothetical protein
MKNRKPNRRRVVAYAILAALISLMGLQLATSARTAAAGLADADLSAEDRIIDSFVNDLGKFDKKGLELGKKASLTRLEFDAHQRDAEALRNRVSGVQNALREVIRKLKAVGQWDNLDQIALAKVRNSTFQDFVRGKGLKRTLEDGALNLSGDAGDIAKPLDSLRRKIQAQASDGGFESGSSSLASRAVRVAFEPEPAVFRDSLRCRAASLRFGITALVFGEGPKTTRAATASNCACEGTHCDEL